MYVYNFTVNQNIVFYLFNNLVFASYYHHLMFGNFFFIVEKQTYLLTVLFSQN